MAFYFIYSYDSIAFTSQCLAVLTYVIWFKDFDYSENIVSGFLFYICTGRGTCASLLTACRQVGESATFTL